MILYDGLISVDPSFLASSDGFLGRDLITDGPDQALTTRKAGLDTCIEPFGIGDTYNLLGRAPTGSLASFAARSHQDAKLIRVMLVRARNEIRTPANHVPKRNQKLREQGCRISFGVRVDRLHQVSRQAVESFRLQLSWPFRIDGKVWRPCD